MYSADFIRLSYFIEIYLLLSTKKALILLMCYLLFIILSIMQSRKNRNKRHLWFIDVIKVNKLVRNFKPQFCSEIKNKPKIRVIWNTIRFFLVQLLCLNYSTVNIFWKLEKRMLVGESISYFTRQSCVILFQLQF